MSFVTMKPEDVWALLEGVEDVITPAVEQERKDFKNFRCPACYETGAEKVVPGPLIEIVQNEPVVIRTPFSSDRPLARGYAKCLHCGTLYYPYSGVIMHDNLSTLHVPHSDQNQD